MSTITEIVYKGFNNVFSLLIKQNGVVVDFSGTTSMKLTFGGIDVTTGITFTNLGIINFTIGALAAVIALADGVYEAELLVIDPAHPLGQIFIHPEGDDKLHIKLI